jgi:pimeloyl-ACP methyl ester carboxylesterase
MGMFEGFTLERVDVGPAQLRVRHGGSGPPVLLLHGHPRTHATWHKVAPLLAERFTVVCPDLRGYGQSSKPPTTPDTVRRPAGHLAGLGGRPPRAADRLRAPHRRGGAGGTGGLPGRVLRALSAPAYWPSRPFRARALRTA